MSIEQRPEVIARKIRTWRSLRWRFHWSPSSGKFLIRVDRTSRLALLEKLARKSAKMITRAVLASLVSLTTQWMSITFDNGDEFAAHEQITKAAGIVVYFAHPSSSYEGGTNENTNGLIRPYFPKKCDLTQVSKASVKKDKIFLTIDPKSFRFQNSR